MKVTHILAIALLAASGCATLAAPEDAMCGPLRVFASSISPDETRLIRFHTTWGSNFKDSPDPAIFAKRCDHQGYEPAKAVCAYLMKHGAVEFSENNAERALSCLAPPTRFAPEAHLHTGAFSVDYGTPERGSNITLTFQEASSLGGMVLRIEADGY
jgi:hypothetical protein